jgi:hypothetical protein
VARKATEGLWRKVHFGGSTKLHTGFV